VVHFVSCERFTNQYIEALQANTVSKFREFFRSNVDVLLIDDIQFLSNKERLQEEFYHTFNDLHMQGKQIVMTSDKSPQELQHIEQRMVNRFECGMVVDVQSPDFETRVAIIQKKLEQYGAQLDHEVCYYLANKVRNDVRKIEGALVKLLGYASVRHQPVTLDLARECLRTYVAAQCVTLDAIQKAVADFFDVRVADLRSNKRPRAIAHPRQIAMYLCRELTTASLIDIAQSFGGKDHTTVLYACRKIEQVKEQDEMVNQQLHALKRRLGSSDERGEQIL
jgi:chromosomal replication initiator protein